MTTTVQEPALPDGYRRTEGGLLVPEGTSDLTQANQHLLALRKKIDVDSLQAALQNIYIEAAEYTDEKGVKRYKKLEGEEVKEVVSGMMSELEYHVHFRHFRASEKMLKQLRGCTGPNGENYVTSQTKKFFPVNEKDLESSLLEDGVTLKTIASLGNDLGNKYEQKVLFDGLDNKYGSDSEQHKDGLLNLNSVFKISPKVNRKKLVSLDMDTLKETYVKWLYESMKRME